MPFLLNGSFSTLRFDSCIPDNANNCPTKFGSSVVPYATWVVLRQAYGTYAVGRVWAFFATIFQSFYLKLTYCVLLTAIVEGYGRKQDNSV